MLVKSNSLSSIIVKIAFFFLVQSNKISYFSKKYGWKTIMVSVLIHFFTESSYFFYFSCLFNSYAQIWPTSQAISALDHAYWYCDTDSYSRAIIHCSFIKYCFYWLYFIVKIILYITVHLVRSLHLQLAGQHVTWLNMSVQNQVTYLHLQFPQE